MKEHLAWFSEKRNGWWGQPLLTEILGQPIIARSASAVTPSEKSSINANKKSTTRFLMSLRRSSYVAPKSPERGSEKRKTADLREKWDFA